MLEYSLVIAAGVLATLAMALLMYLIHTFGLANGDMIRALGSYMTRRYENSLGPGVALYLIGGVGFALIYFAIMRYLGVTDPSTLTLIGGVMGLGHGVVVSILLVISVAEHHPIAGFREVGFGVAITHILGHVVYGACLGLLIGLAASRFAIY